MTDRPLIGCGPLSRRFDEAVGLAADLHRAQVRKGTHVPYLAHLLAVAALVLEQGGDEDEAIAGLLHDAVEDQGGQPTLIRIRERFGERVAAIVAACSDTDQQPKPPWRERKEAYIAHLGQPGLDPGVLRVSLADKLHNLRAMLFDLRTEGATVWRRFSAPPADQLWYYRSLAHIFAERPGGPWAEELLGMVQDLERFAR